MAASPTNAEIALALYEIARFLEAEEVPFKPAAYEKAADAVASWERPLAQIHAEGGVKGLRTVPGVGEGIAKKIAEFLKTRRIAALDDLRRKCPIDILALTRIEGVGAKSARALYRKLGVTDIGTLEAACREGRVRALAHFGEKSEQKILKGLSLLKQSGERRPIGSVLFLARRIRDRLRAHPAVRRAEIAGSLRRFKETIGDFDFLVLSEKPETVAGFFAAMPEVVHVHAKGESKVLVRLANGLDADLRIVPEASFGAALAYFTGSREHGVALRTLAIEKGLKLNEYGVFRGEKRLAGRTEEEVYAALGLPFIPPEIRENTGEIEAARAGKLPALLPAGAVRGDLQVQTDWTDGDASIEEMARAARRAGLSYIAVTDHTRDLAMTGGQDEKKLLEQLAAIRRIDAGMSGFRVFAGAEVNIRKDGTLDIDDETLARLDVVGAAIHSHFRLPRAEMTARAVRAIENPNVDVFFHPLARHLGKREPVDLDMDAVIEAARRTGTVLEIDAQPSRLDLPAEQIRKAVAAGVPLVVDSDAHHTRDFSHIETFGVPLARRGWAGAADVLNTLPAEAFLGRLKGRAPRRKAPKKARKKLS